MRKSNKLSAAFIRSIDLTKPKLYADGGNLYLQVSKFKTTSWLFRFMRDGVAKSMGLGPLGTISLAEARERARKARQGLLDDIDPLAAKRQARVEHKLEAAKAMTFKAAADAYIKANEASWKNEKHVAQWHATFNETKRGKRPYPAATAAINDLPVAAIDTALVHKVLEPIWRKTPETASRVRGRIERVLAWATVAGHRSGDNPARWAGHLAQLLPAKTKVAAVKHHDAVPYPDMAVFMGALRAKSGVSARALEFTILTAARTGEVIGARWSEINLNDKVWAIPAERMKAGREHRVPLSDRAIAVLKALPRGASGGEFVFARESKPLSNMSMLELLRGMRKGATVHGFRSSFRDWAGNETNFPREVVEHALAHSIGDKAEQAYRRDTAVERRRKLMDAWARYCERKPVDAAKVISIGKAAR
jgi:integrase